MGLLSNEDIQQIKEIMLRPPSSYRSFIVMPQWLAEKESAAHSNNFIFYNDGTMTWCGYIVYIYGDRYESS
jgi:hypothetical protein